MGEISQVTGWTFVSRFPPPLLNRTYAKYSNQDGRGFCPKLHLAGVQCRYYSDIWSNNTITSLRQPLKWLIDHTDSWREVEFRCIISFSEALLHLVMNKTTETGVDVCSSLYPFPASLAFSVGCFLTAITPTWLNLEDRAAATWVFCKSTWKYICVGGGSSQTGLFIFSSSIFSRPAAFNPCWVFCGQIMSYSGGSQSFSSS